MAHGIRSFSSSLTSKLLKSEQLTKYARFARVPMAHDTRPCCTPLSLHHVLYNRGRLPDAGMRLISKEQSFNLKLTGDEVYYTA